MVIIGAGPAGLTAAYQLAKAGRRSTVLEADSVVGGISRTVERDGWRFDIGGHRFFTKVQPVEDFWHEILPDEDFMLRPRKSRIYYQGKFYDYPLKAMNALGNLGVIEAVRCVLSYVWARVHPPKRQDMYEGWLAARFGWRLYRHFFKTYTEKVWGHPPSEMPADWAAQRVKNLSLAIGDRQRPAAQAQPEGHHLPDRGVPVPQAGARDDVGALPGRGGGRRDQGGDGHPGQPRSAIGAAGPSRWSADSEGGQTEYPASAVISSMPLSALIAGDGPARPRRVRRAADDLAYRDFLTVALVVPGRHGGVG